MLLRLFELCGFCQRRLLQLGDAAEAQLRRAVEIAAPLRQLRLGLGSLGFFLELAQGPDEALFVLPDALHLIGALAQLRDLRNDGSEAFG